MQDQSIRQSYFEKGQLHFSRLTPPRHSSIGSIAQAFASESLKLQQYLASQRLVGRSQTITAHILAHPGALKAIGNSCVDTPAVRFNVLDINECAKRTGLRSLPPDSHGEALFLHPTMTSASDTVCRRRLAAYLPGRPNGHPALRSRRHRTVCLPVALETSFSTRINSPANQQGSQAETEQSRQRYADMLKTFPSVPVDHETLKA